MFFISRFTRPSFFLRRLNFHTVNSIRSYSLSFFFLISFYLSHVTEDPMAVRMIVYMSPMGSSSSISLTHFCYKFVCPVSGGFKILFKIRCVYSSMFLMFILFEFIWGWFYILLLYQLSSSVSL